MLILLRTGLIGTGNPQWVGVLRYRMTVTYLALKSPVTEAEPLRKHSVSGMTVSLSESSID